MRFWRLSAAVLALAMLASLLGGSTASGASTTLPAATATSKRVSGAVDELRRLAASPAPGREDVIAATERYSEAVADAKRLLRLYTRSDGPVGSRREDTLVARLMTDLEAGRAHVRRLTGVAPPVAASQASSREEVLRATRRLGAGPITRRLKALGIGKALSARAVGQARSRALNRGRALIRNDSAALATEVTVTAFATGQSPRRVAERLVRARLNEIATGLIVGPDPVRRLVLRLTGLDRIIERPVRDVATVVAWGPSQVVRVLRRIAGRTLPARATRSTRGLTRLAGRLERARASADLGVAERLVDQASSASNASANLQLQLARSGRTDQRRAHNRALARLISAQEALIKRFRIGSLLHARRARWFDEACLIDDEVAVALRSFRTGEPPAAGGASILPVADVSRSKAPAGAAVDTQISVAGFPAGALLEVRVFQPDGSIAPGFLGPSPFPADLRAGADGTASQVYGIVRVFSALGEWTVRVEVKGRPETAVATTFQVVA